MDPSTETDRPRAGDPQRRPCLAAGLALAGGAAAGRSLAAWTWSARPDPFAVALLAGAALLVLAFALRRRRGGARFAWWPAALVALGATVAFGRAVEAPAPLPFDAPLRGTWREEKVGGARIELEDGRSVDARFTTKGPPPGDGEAVLLLPPFDARRAVTGPVASDDGRPELRVRLAPDQVVRLGGGTTVASAPLRERLAVRANELPASPGRARSGLAAALLVGDRSALDPDVSDLFTRTGTRHLLALSGLHVGLFALLVALPLRRLARRFASRLGAGAVGARRAGALAAVAALVLFTILGGSASPIVRAAIVATAGLVARDWPTDEPRRVDAISLLAFALALELAVDAEAWRDPGLAMSFGACFALALAARPCAEALSRALFGRSLGERTDPFVWHRSRPEIAFAVLVLRARRTLCWALGASVAASLGTLPVLWSTFGEASPVGLLATPVVTPLLLLWLPAIWLGVLAPTTWLAHPQAFVESAVLAALEHFDRWPGTPALLPERPAWCVALLCAATLACCVSPRSRALVRATLVGWCALLLPWRAAPSELELWALDVGHGTCVVAEGPGLPLLVFDAGTRSRHGLEREGLAPILRRIDATDGVLVVSHDDHDHSAGLPWLLSRASWRAVVGDVPHDVEFEASTLSLDAVPASTRLPSPIGALATDVEVELLRGARTAGNEGSTSVLLTSRGERALLFGDATEEGLVELVRAGLAPRRVDLVLLPHHGGHGSGLDLWLAGASIGTAWISAERRPDVVRELERRGIPWRGTFDEGSLGPWPP
ncbi:MAG: ComEC/Rec2 family competence protein [Planctomycetota bacterium]